MRNFFNFRILEVTSIYRCLTFYFENSFGSYKISESNQVSCRAKFNGINRLEDLFMVN